MKAAFSLATALSLAVSVAAAQDNAGGDPERGAAVILDAERGNCTICHIIPGLGLPDEAQGNLGPPLDGIGAWRSAGELVAIITDPRTDRPDTVMPAYGITAGLIDVAPDWRDRPILSGDDIADVVAYLMELR